MTFVANAVGAALGLGIDRVVGEPPPSVPHPVALFGTLMGRLERAWYRDSRAVGVGHAAAGVGVGVAAGLGVGALMRGARGPALAAVALAAWSATAGRMLEQTARELGVLLEAGDLEAARRRLPALVGRDASELDEAEMARAVVESVAENCVDAVVAPALWALVAGAPGVLAHRGVNTLDAMVGHRSARYARFGWASARLDDVAAWVPARLCALAVVAVRPERAGDVLRAVGTQAPAHPSPNSGVAEAAFAAALGLRLGGTNRYGERVEVRPQLGRGRPPTGADVARAADLLVRVTQVTAAGLAAVAVAGSVFGRARRGRRPV